ncbi:Conserved_hypothetical protein [Hexamita inflata]|uniref:Uncharacterized protein n=1 Tax=Hexamita inflata TaxID=28002 RepID=A0AA86U5H5_9EUKA|nr:Conserved hypothetical protein [Hexamita inflata]
MLTLDELRVSSGLSQQPFANLLDNACFLVHQARYTPNLSTDLPLLSAVKAILASSSANFCLEFDEQCFLSDPIQPVRVKSFSKFACPVCKLIMTQSAQCTCGCVVCLRCAYSTLGDCPKCAKSSPSYATQTHLLQQVRQAEFQCNQCKQTGTYQFVLDHQNVHQQILNDHLSDFYFTLYNRLRNIFLNVKFEQKLETLEEYVQTDFKYIDRDESDTMGAQLNLNRQLTEQIKALLEEKRINERKMDSYMNILNTNFENNIKEIQNENIERNALLEQIYTLNQEIDAQNPPSLEDMLQNKIDQMAFQVLAQQLEIKEFKDKKHILTEQITNTRVKELETENQQLLDQINDTCTIYQEKMTQMEQIQQQCKQLQTELQNAQNNLLQTKVEAETKLQEQQLIHETEITQLKQQLLNHQIQYQLVQQPVDKNEITNLQEQILSLQILNENLKTENVLYQGQMEDTIQIYAKQLQNIKEPQSQQQTSLMQKSQLAEQHAGLEQSKAAISNLEQHIQVLEQHGAQLESLVEKLRAENTLQAGQIEDTTKIYAEKEEELTQLQQNHSQLQSEAEDLRESLKRQEAEHHAKLEEFHETKLLMETNNKSQTDSAFEQMKEMQEALEKQSAENKAVVEEKTAEIQVLSQTLSELESQLTSAHGLENEAASKLAAKEEELHAIQTELQLTKTTREEELSVAEKHLSDLHAAETQLEELKSLLKASQDEASNGQLQREQLERTIGELEQQLEDSKKSQLAEQHAGLEQSKAAISNLEQHIQVLEQHGAQLESLVEKLRAENTLQAGQIEDTTKIYAEKEGELTQLQQNHSQLQSEVEDLRESLKRQEAEHHAKLEEFHKTKLLMETNNKSQTDSAFEQMKEMQEALEKQSAENKAVVEEKTAEIQVLSQTLSELESQLTSAHGLENEAASKLAAKEEELHAIQTELQLTKTTREEELSVAEKHLSDLHAAETQLEELKSLLKASQDEASNGQLQREQLERTIGELEQQLQDSKKSQLAEQHAGLEQSKATISNLEQHIQVLEQHGAQLESLVEKLRAENTLQAGQIEDTTKIYAEKEGELTQLQQNHSQLQSEVEDLRESLKRQEAEHHAKLEEFHKTKLLMETNNKSQTDSAFEQMKEMQEALEKQSAENKAVVEEKTAEIQVLSQKLSELESQLTSAHGLENEAASKLAAKEEELHAIQTELQLTKTTREEELSVAEKHLSDLHAAETQLEELKSLLKASQDEASNGQLQREQLERTIGELEQQLEDSKKSQLAEQHAGLEQSKAAISNLEQHIQVLEQHGAQLESLVEKLRAENTLQAGQIEDTTKIYAEKEEELTQLQQNHSQLQSEVEDLRESLKRQKQYHAKLGSSTKQDTDGREKEEKSNLESQTDSAFRANEEMQEARGNSLLKTRQSSKKDRYRNPSPPPNTI